MRSAHQREQAVGMAYYCSDHEGTGGELRTDPDDFQVREIEGIDPKPIDADPDAYPHLVVRARLTDWETHEFAGALGNALGISRERVRWAGTKDARATTTQLVSVDRIEPDELPDIAGVELEPIGRFGRPVAVGDLLGNEFTITVRKPVRPEAVESITGELGELAGAGQIGIPNFFGQQRFGSRRPITHEVGLAIVQGDWEGAVMHYLANSFETEPSETRAAREFVTETRDWGAAIDRFPRSLGFERAMLDALAAVEGSPTEADFRAAVEQLPRNLQRLFVHAAQSFAFNRIISERLSRGLPLDRPVAGDLVCVADRDAPESLELPDTDRIQQVTERRLETVTRHCDRGRAFVTAPLVGTETTFAEGEPGEIERAVCDELGLEQSDFDLPEPFHSTGTRRAVLVRTGIDIDRRPLTLDFSLPRGSYATVVLREYLKVDPIALG